MDILEGWVPLETYGMEGKYREVFNLWTWLFGG